MEFMEDKVIQIVNEATSITKDREYRNDLIMDKLLEEFSPADVGQALLIATQKLTERNLCYSE